MPVIRQRPILRLGWKFCGFLYGFLFYSITSFMRLEPNGCRSLLLSASEGSWAMGLALELLSIPSMFVGFFGRDLFILLGWVQIFGEILSFVYHLIEV